MKRILLLPVFLAACGGAPEPPAGSIAISLENMSARRLAIADSELCGDYYLRIFDAEGLPVRWRDINCGSSQSALVSEDVAPIRLPCINAARWVEPGARETISWDGWYRDADADCRSAGIESFSAELCFGDSIVDDDSTGFAQGKVVPNPQCETLNFTLGVQTSVTHTVED